MFLLLKLDFYERFNHPSLEMTIRVILDPGVPSMNQGFEPGSRSTVRTFAETLNRLQTSEILGRKLWTKDFSDGWWVTSNVSREVENVLWF